MGKRTLLIATLLIGLLGFASCGSYNSLIASEESVEAAWSQVENVYQRRADLIPNLVETVKGAANFEQETLTGVVEARAKATQITAQLTPDVINDPQALERFQAAQGQLSSALSRLLVTIERYPELKANQNYLALQSQLEGTENRIAVERGRYNDIARDFNTRIRRIPGRFIASFAGMESKAYFEAKEGADEAPAVRFDG